MGNSFRVFNDSREESESVSSKALILWRTTLSRLRGTNGGLVWGPIGLRPMELERSIAATPSATGASPGLALRNEEVLVDEVTDEAALLSGGLGRFGSEEDVRAALGGFTRIDELRRGALEGIRSC